jgi:hypothetical protein
MERQLFAVLFQWLFQIGSTHQLGKKQFSDVTIVGVLIWAALHDRPIFWACQDINWPADRAYLLQLPSPATMSRRLKSYQVLLLLEQFASFLRDFFPRHLLKIADSKPMIVGPCSKDKDARRGYAAGEMAKGYKICSLLDAGGAFDAWRLEPLNTADSHGAMRLLQNYPGPGYIVADCIFDSNPLYQTAGNAGWQLIAKPQKPDAASRGHRRQSPFRLRGLDLLANPLAACGQCTSFGQDLMRLRDTIERRFGFLGNFGGGLAPLPNWVRRPHRVVVWIHAKLMIAAVRDILNHRHLAA